MSPLVEAALEWHIFFGPGGVIFFDALVDYLVVLGNVVDDLRGDFLLAH